MIDQHLVDAFDVMADMVFRPALDDVDSERAVILEEIAMYEDDPQEKVFDVLGRAVFGDHPLGRAIIGRAMVTVYRVLTVKHVVGLRTFVAVDGGMSDNPRPALYGARYSVHVPRGPAAPAQTVTVVGPRHRPREHRPAA